MPKGDQFSTEQIEAIRSALRELCAWAPVRRSPQLEAFLVYIVEARLSGNADAIKAYSIAVDVFGRDADFDPQTDPIVRVQARRLRALLDEYYATIGARHAVRITLPRGRYVPEFVFGPGLAKTREPEAGAAMDGKAPARARNRRALAETVLIVGALAALFTALSLFFLPGIVQRNVVVPQEGQPRAPLVIVEEFENLTSDMVGAPLVAGLAIELVTDLGLFPHIEARYGGTQAQVGDEDIAGERPAFVLTGVVRRSDDGLQYGAVLTRRDIDAPQVSLDIEEAFADTRPAPGVDDVSRAIAMRLARPRGPLHAPARTWIETTPTDDVILAPYACYVAFSIYRETFDPELAARVGACAQAQLPSGANAAQARAMLATLTSDQAREMGTDLPEAQDLLAEAEALAMTATEAAPTHSFVWAQYGHVAWAMHEHQVARDRYGTAAQLNPADIAMLARFAAVLAQTGNWAPALAYSEAVLAAEPDPPPPFHVVPALWALREGDYDAARAHAETMVQAYPHLATAILVAIGGQTLNAEIIDAHLPRLLAFQRFRRIGIMPALRQDITDPALLRAISNGISRAGVPLDRLVHPF